MPSNARTLNALTLPFRSDPKPQTRDPNVSVNSSIFRSTELSDLIVSTIRGVNRCEIANCYAPFLSRRTGGSPDETNLDDSV